MLDSEGSSLLEAVLRIGSTSQSVATIRATGNITRPNMISLLQSAETLLALCSLIDVEQYEIGTAAAVGCALSRARTSAALLYSVCEEMLKHEQQIYMGENVQKALDAYDDAIDRASYAIGCDDVSLSDFLLLSHERHDPESRQHTTGC